MVNILQQWERGEEPKKGPQIDRANSIGPQGRTSLYDIPEVLFDRDFAAEK
jgi:hypothetical protein